MKLILAVLSFGILSINADARPKCADELILLLEPMLIANGEPCKEVFHLWRPGKLRPGMCKDAIDQAYANMYPFLIALSDAHCKGKCKSNDLKCWHELP